MNLIRTKSVHENLAHFNRILNTGEPLEQEKAHKMIATLQSLIAQAVVKPTRLTTNERLKRDKMLHQINHLQMNIEVYRNLAPKKTNVSRRWEHEIAQAQHKISLLENGIRKITQL